MTRTSMQLEFPLLPTSPIRPCSVDAYTYLALAHAGSIADVRAPAEYARGHIPGAVNVPLFTDEQRAEVGTIYTKKGQKAAVELGFSLVDGRMDALRRALLALAHSGAVRIHCWRGGMRSASVAWLAARSGVEPILLTGGYKAYRALVHRAFEYPWRLIVLAGRTGVGKTEILQHLAQLNEQVVDLEGLAHHKGSAFGALGQTEQPSTEQFENNLHQILSGFNPHQRIWVEGESLSIGRIFVPKPFYSHMLTSRTVRVETPFEERVARLVRDYTVFPPESIIEALEKITRRMGGDQVKQCRQSIELGNFHDAVAQTLAYYDRQYDYTLTTHSGQITTLNTRGCPPKQVAAQLVEMANEGKI